MRNNKSIALLMGNNSYVGREYANRLIKQKVNFDILIFGKKLTNRIDIDRVKNFWKPKSQDLILKKRNSIFFDKINSSKMINFLKEKKYYLGIQGGGLGLIEKEIIKCFKKGILNLHPGKLPEYRGSSAPEFQIKDKKRIYGSFHFIDEKIDSGKLVYSKKLNLNLSSYEKMRAQIYPEMSKSLPRIIDKILKNKIKSKNLKIYEKKYSPKKFIGKEFIKKLKFNWADYAKYYDTK